MKLNPIQKILFSAVKEKLKEMSNDEYPGAYKKLKFLGMEIDKESCFANASSLYNSVDFIVITQLYGEKCLFRVTVDNNGNIIDCHTADDYEMNSEDM